jgi:hypothetical protein
MSTNGDRRRAPDYILPQAYVLPSKIASQLLLTHRFIQTGNAPWWRLHVLRHLGLFLDPQKLTTKDKVLSMPLVLAFLFADSSTLLYYFVHLHAKLPDLIFCR